MAVAHHPNYSRRDSLYWDETECLNYYGMLSLHEIFEIVGSQLTEMDIDVLSFLLEETSSCQHPLDPAGWTVEPQEGDEDHPGVSPSPALLNAWRRLQPQAPPCPIAAFHKPKTGLDLLLELEKRDYLSEGKLEPLLQLLRVLTRHDLLPFVSRKRRRTVSPERIGQNYGTQNRGLACSSALPDNCGQTEMPLPTISQHWRASIAPPMPGPTPRRRKKRGHGWSRRAKRADKMTQPPSPPEPEKVSCDVRLRVRAEYLEHESALRGGVASDKQQPLERQFELFSQANGLLRARDLGSIVCDIKFTELDNLEAFWADYLSGALLEALKGVFITDSLRMAAGAEGVRLLISVDQDDYEQGRRALATRRRAPF